MPNQIDGTIKELRSKKLIELSDKNEKMYNEQYIGKNVEVLFEEKDGEYFKGHTKNYIMVLAKGEGLENCVKEVKINNAVDEYLVGDLI